MRKQRLIIEDIEEDKKRKKRQSMLLSTIETLKQILAIDIMQIIRDRYPMFQKSPISKENPTVPKEFKIKNLTATTIDKKEQHHTGKAINLNKKKSSIKNNSTSSKTNR